MTELAFTVEPFQPGVDIPADIALLHLGIRRQQERDGENKFSNIYDSQQDLSDIETYYLSTGGNFFVAHDLVDGSPIGFVGLLNAHRGHGIIRRMSVIKERRRKGIGAALMREELEWTRANGFSRLTLTTGGGENARSIYEKFGFEVIGQIKKRDKPDDLLMALNLAT